MIDRKKGEQKIYTDLEGIASKTVSDKFSHSKMTEALFKTYANDEFAETFASKD